MSPLTDRQQEILDFIIEYIEENAYPPTMREIADAFGLRSTQGVFEHLNALEVKGAIERVGGRARAIRVLVPSDDGK